MVETTTKQEKEIEAAYERLFSNEHELRYKLDELINKKNWDNSKLRKEVQVLNDNWFRIEHDIFALDDKQNNRPHDPECICQGVTQTGKVIPL